MSAKQVVPGLYLLSNNNINAYLLEDGDDLVLIDTGLPTQAGMLQDDMRSVGHDPSELTNIIVTHEHPDHLGSAVELSGGTVPISMHPAGNTISEAGVIKQGMVPGPGLLNKIMYKLLISQDDAEFPAFTPDKAINDGDVLDIAGGLEVIHTPGHTSGHVSLLWKKDSGLLIAGDAAANIPVLNYMMAYDDVELGKKSLALLSAKSFEAAVFGHGKPILSGASTKFAKKFG